MCLEMQALRLRMKHFKTIMKVTRRFRYEIAAREIAVIIK